tara:strand:+ start:99 stop:338 length:240 start_codon:yes stop_codon:yes gene_type:complete
MTIKIWDILAGPILISDSDDPDEYPEECQELLICKAEVDGKIETIQYWFENPGDSNEWVQHFSTSIEPLEVNSWGMYDA